MKATMTTVVAAVWMATAAATIGLAAPAHADSPVNLTVPDDVRAQLVQAGAVLTGRPASEYTVWSLGRPTTPMTQIAIRIGRRQPCPVPRRLTPGSCCRTQIVT